LYKMIESKKTNNREVNFIVFFIMTAPLRNVSQENTMKCNFVSVFAY